MPALWLMISSVGYQANPTCPVANPDTVSLLRFIIIRGYLRPVAIRGYLRPVAIRGYRCPVTLTTREKTQAYSHTIFISVIRLKFTIHSIAYMHLYSTMDHHPSQPSGSWFNLEPANLSINTALRLKFIIHNQPYGSQLIQQSAIVQ